MRTIAFGSALLLITVSFSLIGEAHKAVTSKHTYNADVQPIFATRCAHCHVPGGVGPMSLVTYDEAFPWAESLRTELLGLDEDEPDDFVKVAHSSLSAKELDIVLDWAVGGTPEGDASKAPAPVALKNDWAGGQPDLVLRLPAPFSIPADTMELTHEFVLASGVTSDRAIRAVDLLPGTPAVVRDATISIRTADGTSSVSGIIGRWTPLQLPAAIALAPGTVLPASGDLIARIHYKKTWKYEGQALTDQSSVGLYFADK